MVGGAYLCYEGFEKISHRYFYDTSEDESKHTKTLKALNDPEISMVDFEKNKIKGAIRTDFILSAEIIAIALGTVKDSPFMMQIIVVISAS